MSFCTLRSTVVALTEPGMSQVLVLVTTVDTTTPGAV